MKIDSKNYVAGITADNSFTRSGYSSAVPTTSIAIVIINS